MKENHLSEEIIKDLIEKKLILSASFQIKSEFFVDFRIKTIAVELEAAVNNKRSTIFIQCSAEQFLELAETYTNLHEVGLTGSRIKLEADFDAGSRVLIGKIVNERNIVSAWKEFIKKYYPAQAEDLDCLKYIHELEMEKCFFSDSSTLEKTSIHFTFCNYIQCLSLEHQKEFWEFFCVKFPECPRPDFTIYQNNHQVRTLGSSKYNEARFLTPIVWDEEDQLFYNESIEEVNRLDYLMTVTEDPDICPFVLNHPKTLFCKIKSLPRSSDRPIQMPAPSPAAIARFSELFSKFVAFAREKADHLFESGSSSNPFACWTAMCARNYIGCDAAKKLHYKIFKPIFGSSYSDVDDLIDFIAPLGVRTFERLLEKSELHTSYFVHYCDKQIDFKTIKSEWFLPDYIEQQKKRYKIFRAGCGRKKTEAIIAYAKKQNKKMLLITYRNEVGRNFLAKFKNSSDILMHIDEKGKFRSMEELKNAKHVACSLESLHKLHEIFPLFDLFVFDEGESFLRQQFHVKPCYYDFTLACIALIVKNGECMFFSANSTYWTAKYLIEVGGADPAEIVFVDVVWKYLKDHKLKIVSNYTKLILEQLEAGKKGVVFFGRKRDLKAFAELCKEKFPAKKIHVICSDEKTLDTTKINEEMQTTDLLLFTSSAESAVSIVEPVDFTFLVPCKWSCSYLTLFQASFRVRNLRGKIIYIYYPYPPSGFARELSEQHYLDHLSLSVNHHFGDLGDERSGPSAFEFKRKQALIRGKILKADSDWKFSIDRSNPAHNFFAELFVFDELGRDSMLEDFLRDMRLTGIQIKNCLSETALSKEEKKIQKENLKSCDEKVLIKELAQIGSKSSEHQAVIDSQLAELSKTEIERLCRVNGTRGRSITASKLSERFIARKRMNAWYDYFLRRKVFAELFEKKEKLRVYNWLIKAFGSLPPDLNGFIDQLEIIYQHYWRFFSSKASGETEKMKKIRALTGRCKIVAFLTELIKLERVNETLPDPKFYKKPLGSAFHKLFAAFGFEFFDQELKRDEMQAVLIKFIRNHLKELNAFKVVSHRGSALKSTQNLSLNEIKNWINPMLHCFGWSLSKLEADPSQNRKNDVWGFEDLLR